MILYLDLIISFIALIICAYTDIKKRTIPNSITIPLIPIGFIYSVMLYGIEEGLKSQLWLIPLFVVCFILFKLHQVGGGDAKLMLGIGSLLGIENSLLLFLLTFIVSWFYALYIFLKNRRIKGGSLKEKQKIMIPLAFTMLIAFCMIAFCIFLI